ncbi:hypothetical protein GF336_04960 [Candidatus Woesearchaeota archaeon]|nr:hypothetical protein [Candidatus Woesearchaeota archaeon]
MMQRKTKDLIKKDILIRFAPHKIKIRTLLKVFSNQPILIGGCARSGTTLLLSMLDAQPEVFCIPHETSLFTVRYSKNKKINGFLNKMAIRLLISYYNIPKKAERWCEKTPRNVQHIKNIENVFKNNFKFIHIVRDGRDVVTSRHPDNPDKYWVPIERWVDDVKAGLKYKKHPNVFTLKYEDLVLDFNKTMKKLCIFLDISYKDALNWVEKTGLKKSNAWFGAAKNVHAKSIGRWKKKKYEKRIRQFMDNKEAVKLLKELEYQP